MSDGRSFAAARVLPQHLALCVRHVDVNPVRVRPLLLLTVAVLTLASCSDDAPATVGAGEATASISPPVTPPRTPSPTATASSSPEPGTAEFAAQAFIRFATGQSTSLPVDTPVHLLLDGEPVKTLSESETTRSETYEVCRPDGDACASAVDLIATSPEAGLDKSGGRCIAPSMLTPRDTGGTSAAFIRPSSSASCATDYAVQVWTNDVGQLVAVNLVLGQS